VNPMLDNAARKAKSEQGPRPALVPVEIYRWWITDRDTGGRRKTHHRMTVTFAQENYPGATPVEGSVRVRMICPSHNEAVLARQHRRTSRTQAWPDLLHLSE